MSKYDELKYLDDIYKTIEDEIENKELAKFIVEKIKTTANNCKQLQTNIINNFTNNELIEELSKRLGGKDE